MLNPNELAGGPDRGTRRLRRGGHSGCDGTTNIDGALSANGNGGTNGAGGSGGSLILLTPILTGSGIISANGGTQTGNSSFGAGGGGRVSVQLASGASFGSIDFQAFGGLAPSGGSPISRRGTAGTIYLQDGTQLAGNGLVLVDNNNVTTTGYTQLPAFLTPTGGELLQADVILTNLARLQLTNDLEIHHLDIDSLSALFLEGHTLTLKSFNINGNFVDTPGTYLPSNLLIFGRVLDGSVTGGYLLIEEIPASAIPEPAAGWLLACGLLGLLRRRRCNR